MKSTAGPQDPNTNQSSAGLVGTIGIVVIACLVVAFMIYANVKLINVPPTTNATTTKSPATTNTAVSTATPAETRTEDENNAVVQESPAEISTVKSVRVFYDPSTGQLFAGDNLSFIRGEALGVLTPSHLLPTGVTLIYIDFRSANLASLLPTLRSKLNTLFHGVPITAENVSLSDLKDLLKTSLGVSEKTISGLGIVVR